MERMAIVRRLEPRDIALSRDARDELKGTSMGVSRDNTADVGSDADHAMTVPAASGTRRGAQSTRRRRDADPSTLSPHGVAPPGAAIQAAISQCLESFNLDALSAANGS
jgi:hypothetical protein